MKNYLHHSFLLADQLDLDKNGKHIQMEQQNCKDVVATLFARCNNLSQNKAEK